MKVKIYKLLLAFLEEMYYNIMCNRAFFYALPVQCKWGIIARVCSRLIFGMKLL